MTVEELAYDDRFESLLEKIASEKRIRDFDDFRQDVFLEILNDGCSTDQEYKRAARRVAHRYARRCLDADIMAFALEDEDGNTETEEEVMSRLVHSGQAWKVC